MTMSGGALKRAGLTAMRTMRARGGGNKGSFWDDGKQVGRNGYFLNETPPAPGQARKWESWEMPYYLAWGTATLMFTVGLSAKPDTSLYSWAEAEVKKMEDRS
mmetsp:Transcript_34741/g.109717  ORF Transcript_34741/g.109717 Transcript_34741/m.109717 type:complete len:103 (-) Transcript_34741:270-578(-)